MFLQLCVGMFSTDLTLGACEFASESYYITSTNDSHSPSSVGYLECAKATKTDADICKICSCREKKVGVVDGVIVAWAVCVELGEASACVNSNVSNREFCGSTSFSCAQDSSSLGEDCISNVSIDDGSKSDTANASDISANANLISLIILPNPINDSDIFISSSDADEDASSALVDYSSASGSYSTVSSESSSASVNIDLSACGSAYASTESNLASADNACAGRNVSSAESSLASTSMDSSLELNGSMDIISNSVEFDLSSKSSAFENITELVDSSLPSKGPAFVITSKNDVRDDGIAHPGPIGTATSDETPSNQLSDDKLIHHLDTNNGSATESGWPRARLKAMLSIVGGFAIIASLAVVIAMHRKDKTTSDELGTPSDDISCFATPTTDRVDEKISHRKLYDRNEFADSIDNTPLTSIVVMGVNDDVPSVLRPQSQLYFETGGRIMSGMYARSGSAVVSNGEVLQNSYYNAIPASQLQFNISHGPSASQGLPSFQFESIFDTSNTQPSFSSNMSSDYVRPTSERLYESIESSTESFQNSSETSSMGSMPNSEDLTDSKFVEQHVDTINSIDDSTSFALSLLSSDQGTSLSSSLSISDYTSRDTEASEHLHSPEMSTNSSRIAMSFDMGSSSL